MRSNSKTDTSLSKFLMPIEPHGKLFISEYDKYLNSGVGISMESSF